MTRKDTIVIAVLINMGLLALLFATAIVIDDTPATPEPAPVKKEIPVAKAPPPVKKEQAPKPTLEPLFNHVYTALPPEPEPPSPPKKEPASPPAKKEVVAAAPKKPTPSDTVTYTIQEGDRLEKIAKKFGTTVSEIKQTNQLTSEKIRTGQKLQIPKGKAPKKEVLATAPQKKEEFYVVKTGDNPWTIAKQCDVGYNDLLRLNHLDENKAKNLRPGDKIRVR